MKRLIFLVAMSFIIVGCGQDRAGALDDENSTNHTALAGVSHMGEDDDPIDRDGDGLSDEFEEEHGLDPLSGDTDGDGLDDKYEMSHDDVNATNPDTDGDKLLDGEEVNEYNTEPNNPDTDNDALSDYDEVKIHTTNPLESDTDGDGLLDSFEIFNYETNATLKDTDGDKIDDGIEVYSYDTGELNLTILTTPETLLQGYNLNLAMDGIPTKEDDIINALDPTNDSDGDGQSNIKENNCTEGDPADATKMCPFIHETEEGNILTEHGYSYVPGGFDVDGDGINEGGFWMSRFQARNSGIEIPSESVIDKVGNVNQYISSNFKVVNRNIEILNYNESSLNETGVMAGNHLIFDEEGVAGIKRISNFTPYLALVCLSEYRLNGHDGRALDIDITMPTHKQYIQVKMLLDADRANNGDGRHVRNGLLGIDKNVPLFSYNLMIDEFGEEKKEYVRNLIQLRETDKENGDSLFDFSDAPIWWEADNRKFKSFEKGAHSTQDLGNGIGPDKDPYAVIVRGGAILDVTEGISGALTDGDSTDGISFRAVTPYLY